MTPYPAVKVYFDGTAALDFVKEAHAAIFHTYNCKKMPTIIVTGSSRGIGFATAEALLTASGINKVIGVSRTALAHSPELQRLASGFPDRFTYLSGDLSSTQTQDQVIDATNGFLDTVVFNAGSVDPIVRLATVDLNEVKQLLDVNLFSILSLAQKALPLLKKSEQGRMLFVSSGAATGAYAGWGPYCMSKAALNMLSNVFAVEEPTLVSFAFRPGVVETEMQATIRNDKNAKEMGADKHDQFKKYHQNGDLLKPTVPGGILAKMAVGAGREFSGKFLAWNDEKLAAFRE
ncbi:UNVERIFIED_CONTAM: hypothetical protein HDU68_012829 [Siphonaria sp. JEL0065]|nr:hypothetical protein HDU68_012829 [Siphonaria sp. JEL0065]